MKTFNHIDDIWEALDTCTTADQIAEKDPKAEALQLLDEIRNIVGGYADSASVDNPTTQEDLEVLEAKLSELNRKLEAI